MNKKNILGGKKGSDPITKKENCVVIGGEKLKNLNIKPLSIAKFFYEKGIEDIAIIQRLIYLVYCEVLEEENFLLFTEEWQAWSGGPVVESIFYKMRGCLDLDRKKLFNQVAYPSEKNVIDYCEKLFSCYQDYVKIGEEYKFLEETRNKPWEIARYNLSNELEKNKIKVASMINFFDEERKKILLLSLKKLFLWITGGYQHVHKVYEMDLNADIQKTTSLWKKSINLYMTYEQDRI